jgi:hypothetical protein
MKGSSAQTSHVVPGVGKPARSVPWRGSEFGAPFEWVSQPFLRTIQTQDTPDTRPGHAHAHMSQGHTHLPLRMQSVHTGTPVMQGYCVHI